MAHEDRLAGQRKDEVEEGRRATDLDESAKRRGRMIRPRPFSLRFVDRSATSADDDGSSEKETQDEQSQFTLGGDRVAS